MAWWSRRSSKMYLYAKRIKGFPHEQVSMSTRRSPLSSVYARERTSWIFYDNTHVFYMHELTPNENFIICSLFSKSIKLNAIH
jgi:hypothetical protein